MALLSPHSLKISCPEHRRDVLRAVCGPYLLVLFRGRWGVYIAGDIAAAADKLPSTYRAPLHIAFHMMVMPWSGAAVRASFTTVCHSAHIVPDTAVVSAAALDVGPCTAVCFQHPLTAGPAYSPAGGDKGVQFTLRHPARPLPRPPGWQHPLRSAPPASGRPLSARSQTRAGSVSVRCGCSPAQDSL